MCDICILNSSHTAPPPFLETLNPVLAWIAISTAGLGFLATIVALILLIKWRKTKPLLGPLFCVHIHIHIHSISTH